MRIVGIDPSLSRTGLCILEDGETPVTASIRVDSKDSIFKRQRSIVEEVRLQLTRNDVVVLEDFGVSARFAPSGRYIERIELCGMLKLVAPAITRLPWLSVAPTMLKSFITGKSSAHKCDMLQAVQSQWDVQAANDDEADAFGLARYALAAIDQEPMYTRKITKFEKYGLNREHLAMIRFVLTTIRKKPAQVL